MKPSSRVVKDIDDCIGKGVPVSADPGMLAMAAAIHRLTDELADQFNKDIPRIKPEELETLLERVLEEPLMRLADALDKWHE